MGVGVTSRNTEHGAPATEHADTMLAVAAQSIAQGLNESGPFVPDLARLPAAFSERRATFVTLKTNHVLRGCVGTVTASQPLAHDVARNARGAAFEDPRFVPLGTDEWPTLWLSIALLRKPERLYVSTEDELCDTLRPHVDGLHLQWGDKRAFFLPAVWEHMADAHQFVTQLKAKADLALDHWSSDIQLQRVTVETIGPARAAAMAPIYGQD